MSTVASYKLRDYQSGHHNDWCPGCGDFGILAGLELALAELQVPPHKVAIFSGIGCSGKTPHYVNAYGFHTLHGRSVPSATGAALANRDLTVIALGGDGDGYGIGAGYFVNAARRNVDMTYMVHDNHVYGLTKGQPSPTLPKGLRTKAMPESTIQEGLNPLALALAAGYTFVARGFSLDPKALGGLIAQAVRHRGTAFIDVLQTCPTYNDLYTADWYAHNANGASRIYRLEDEGYDGTVADPEDTAGMQAKKLQAIARSLEWGERIPTGILYRVELPTCADALEARIPDYARQSLVDMDLFHRDMEPLLAAFR
jgi:2-oxoglutarate ferredoxin oxidoreductase subunit beta